jgi:hypothetical protein
LSTMRYFIQNSSFIFIYIWNPLQPIFVKLSVFLLLVFIFYFLKKE